MTDTQTRTAGPPIAARRPVTREFSGVAISEDYAWLEDPRDPEVIAYLEAENAYAEAVVDAGLRETLHQELMARIQRTDTRVPVQIGEVFYYIRTEEGRDYNILCRRVGGMEAPEQILLDLNTMAGDFLRLGAWQPSPDHRYLAYTMNETGGIAFTLHVLDMQTGEILPERIPAAPWGLVWVDSERLVYTGQDAALRWERAVLHRLGDDPAADTVLYREADEMFSLNVQASDDRAYLLLHSASAETGEVRYAPLADPMALEVFAPRRPGILYSLQHWAGEFLVLTNEGAVDFQLLGAPVDPARRGETRSIVPPQVGRLLQQV
ncbi:MAG: hypothetical protein QM692_24770, partial [Thermomicrobiales bacterium]